MPQRRKRKQYNPMSLTIFEQVPFREIRMRFDLYDRRLDSRGFNNLLGEARKNGATLPVSALVDQFYAEVQKMGGRRWDTSSLIARLER